MNRGKEFCPLRFPLILIPRVDILKRARCTRKPNCKQVPALPSPEKKISTGTEILIDDIFRCLSFNNKKIKVFFDTLLIDGSECFYPPLAK